MLHMLAAETWTAAEAYRLGLVQEVTEPGQQLNRAVETARKIASMGPLGVRAVLASAQLALSNEAPASAALTPTF